MDIPDPSLVETWPQAVVFIAIIIAVAVVPSLFAYLNAKLTREARDAAKDVRSTLTENNGGSSIRDSLDRIESHLERLDERVGRLEGEAQ